MKITVIVFNIVLFLSVPETRSLPTSQVADPHGTMMRVAEFQNPKIRASYVSSNSDKGDSDGRLNQHGKSNNTEGQ
jgi:hypothetical protein